MNRVKRLVKDIGLFSIASFAPKALSFFLMPLYTIFLTTEAYGTFDLLNSIESLLLPILMLDISDAVMIFTIERCRDGRDEGTPLKFSNSILICSGGVLVVACAAVAAASGMIDAKIACAYVFVKFLLDAYYNNVLAYLRGTDQVPLVVKASLVGSVLGVAFNLLFILGFRWGLYGLLLANVFAQFANNAYIAARAHIFKVSRGSRKATRAEIDEMLRYSMPLILTGIAWWANGTSDRLFVSALAGVSANGLYAVANKIPSVLNMVHSVIYQALQLSVFAENEADDRSRYYERLYRFYCLFMMVAASVVTVFTKPLALLLFQGEFYEAWQFVPGLLLATAMFSMSGYLTTTMAALKQTASITYATVVGALVNCALNFLTIGKLGVMGAVASTVIGYFVIWVLMVSSASKKVGFKPAVVVTLLSIAVVLLQWLVCLVVEEWYFLLFGPVLIAVLNREALMDVVQIVHRFRKCKAGSN